ncbi:terminase [Lacticaseibacillus paracasei]|uniref:phage terminase small subunit P27 family n=1 Tax=Lacticaseibacillus paracasei TaxID=1597 RepID=UPI001062A592|nr:phage terminase small subunit P27 family [Lacticaseibacillus paracasei]TEA91095.1 terminase [Lacticaseibacillus paracasei]TEA93452.1 terminase [Lacticaseibacillus paracasei]
MPENHPKLTVLPANSDKSRSDCNDDMKDIQITPPAHLDDEASKLWKSLIPEIRKLGYLKKVDQPELEMYCIYYSMFLQSEKLVADNGMWLEDKYGQLAKRSPGAVQIDSCVKNMKSLGHDLGLTFDSGLRQITVEEPEKPKQNSPLKEVGFGADV